MKQEQLYQYFIEFVGTNYDGLAYTWQFSDWKRLTMSRADYLTAATDYFQRYYPAGDSLPLTEDSLFQLINDFQNDVKILEVIDSNTE